MKVLVAQIIPMNPGNCTELRAAGGRPERARSPAWAAGESTAASPVTVVDQWTGLQHRHRHLRRRAPQRRRQPEDRRPVVPARWPRRSAASTADPHRQPRRRPATRPPSASAAPPSYRMVSGQWPGGFQGEVTVTQLRPAPFSGWTVALRVHRRPADQPVLERPADPDGSRRHRRQRRLERRPRPGRAGHLRLPRQHRRGRRRGNGELHAPPEHPATPHRPSRRGRPGRHVRRPGRPATGPSRVGSQHRAARHVTGRRATGDGRGVRPEHPGRDGRCRRGGTSGPGRRRRPRPHLALPARDLHHSGQT